MTNAVQGILIEAQRQPAQHEVAGKVESAAEVLPTDSVTAPALWPVTLREARRHRYAVWQKSNGYPYAEGYCMVAVPKGRSRSSVRIASTREDAAATRYAVSIRRNTPGGRHDPRSRSLPTFLLPGVRCLRRRLQRGEETRRSSRSLPPCCTAVTRLIAVASPAVWSRSS